MLSVKELNGNIVKGRTGIIGVPGAQFYANQNTLNHWGTVYQIVEEVETKKPRSRRGVTKSGAGDKKKAVAVPKKKAGPTTNKTRVIGNKTEAEQSVNDKNGEDNGKFFFNKTTDKVILYILIF